MKNYKKIFSYSPRIFFKRVKYFFYLLLCKNILFRLKLLDRSYGDYLKINFWDKKKISDIVSKFNSFDKFNNLKEDCNLIVQNKITIFNYSILNIENNWRKDPVTNYEWNDNIWYRDGRFNLTAGTDLKRPWELSRMYFLVPIALLYYQTKNNHYAKD